jgi:hypothetical protein
MNQTQKALIDTFDLEGVPKEEREAFVEEFGDVIMKALFRKVWFTLTSTQREELDQLLEVSEAHPESEEKQQAVLTFIDEHVPNVEMLVQKEVEKIQQQYKEIRDELTDAIHE